MIERIKSFIKDLKEMWHGSGEYYTHEQMMKDMLNEKETKEALKELFK